MREENFIETSAFFCVGRKLAKKRKETLSSRQEMTLMVNNSQHTTMVDTHVHTLNGRSEYMHATHTNAIPNPISDKRVRQRLCDRVAHPQVAQTTQTDLQTLPESRRFLSKKDHFADNS